MRVSYFIGDEISFVRAQDFVGFLTEVHLSPNPPAIIDVYLRSPGGDLEAYEVIRNAMERSSIKIHLHAVGECHSAAFMLLYFTNNVYKSIGSYAISIAHTITTCFDHRESLNEKSFGHRLKDILEEWNYKIVEEFKKYKVLTPKQLKGFEKGEDIIITYENLYKIMQKCPFGTFLKAGEEIYFEETLDK